MGITLFTKGQEIDYVPQYGGNRDSTDPAIVRLRYVPYEMVLAYGRQIAARTRLLKDQTKAVEITHEIQKKEFLENVTSVSGFQSGGMEITTAEYLWEHAPTELINELILAMEDAAKLSEGQRKNS